MEKLKTIKDLDDKYDDQDKCGYTWNIGDVYAELTKFAKEWIKELEKYKDNDGFCPSDNIRDFIAYNEYGHDTENVINWIEHFFNIDCKKDKKIIGVDLTKGKDKCFINGVKQDDN